MLQTSCENATDTARLGENRTQQCKLVHCTIRLLAMPWSPKRGRRARIDRVAPSTPQQIGVSAFQAMKNRHWSTIELRRSDFSNTSTPEDNPTWLGLYRRDSLHARRVQQTMNVCFIASMVLFSCSSAAASPGSTFFRLREPRFHHHEHRFCILAPDHHVHSPPLYTHHHSILTTVLYSPPPWTSPPSSSLAQPATWAKP